VHIVKALDALPAAVAALARGGDLVITLGAGSIGTVADRIVAELRGGASPGLPGSSTGAESANQGGGVGGADLSAEADAKAESANEGGGEGG
jgi:hypothetical protein